MRNATLCVIVLGAGAALAQSQASQSSSQSVRSIGVVTKLQQGKFTLNTDAGTDLLIELPDGVAVLRVSPGAKDLNAARKINVSDLKPGDRVLVRGRTSDDQKSIVATSVLVMTKTDLDSAREAERLDWQRRGIGGTVKSINPDTKKVTISTTPFTNGSSFHPVDIELAANALLLRYAPDSVKFSDARPSTFVQIKVGDQVAALGAKSEDGNYFIAEKLVSGTFRNFGVTVVSVDAQNGTVTAKDLASGSPILVKTNADSKMHRLPPNVAQMIATFNRNGTAGGATSDRLPASGPGRIPSDEARNFQQVLERTPALAFSELKPGDPLVVVSTEGAKPSEVMAIVILAGVEQILAAQPKGSNQMNLGPWTMGMDQREGNP